MTKTKEIARKSPKQKQNQNIFQGFRAIGIISSLIPLSIQIRGNSIFLTSAILKNFMIFSGENMKLLFVGATENENEISAITSFQDFTFCAVESSVKIYQRQALVHSFECEYQVNHLLILGDLIFCTLDNGVYLYNFKTRDYYNEISTGSLFTITAILHPSTYINKILLASTQGTMQLWNFRSMTLIYEFKSFKSPITCLVQSPSIDVVAIGLLDGSIILYNIRVDKEIMRFQQDGKVCAISFRTDGPPLMASSNPTGGIALWNLQEKRLFHVMPKSHDGSIHTCSFLHGLPILLSAGTDNAIKQWIFDSSDGLPRLLKSRSGHFMPPTRVRYYGGGEGDHGGHSLITCGQDRTLRFFSAIQDSQNVELSQGRLEHKANKLNVDVNSLRLSSIVQFNANAMKQNEWDNIITCHSGEATAKTWSFSKKKIGKHSLASKDGTPIKSVWISSCGNFGFLGSSQGRVDKYNMQSGLYRSSLLGHTKAVTSIVTDNINTLIITGSLDHHIKIWDFNKGTLLSTISLSSSITHLLLHNDSRLVAAVSDNLSITVLDIDTTRIVRVFHGHNNRITDVAFTPDARWLVSAALDATICTWDVATGFLIDRMHVASICTSVDVSPTGAALATTHVGCLGVYLWSNRAVYGHIPLVRVENGEEEGVVELPTVFAGDFEGDHFGDGGGCEGDDDGVFEEMCQDDDELMEKDREEGVHDDFIRFSTLARSRWQNLLHLDAIKERNKSKQAPSVSEKAPFLLTTKAGAVPEFQSAPPQTGESKILTNTMHSLHDTPLVALLKSGASFMEIFAHLKTLGPSGVDLAIQSLPHDSGLVTALLGSLRELFESSGDFELANSYLHLLIKTHGDLIRECDVFGVVGALSERWERLERKMHQAQCLVEFAMN